MSDPNAPAIRRSSSLWLATAGIFLAALLATLASVARADAAPLSKANQEFVDSTVAASMSEAKTPGLSIEISGPEGEYSKAYGWGRMGLTLESMQLADHVRIGSITKTLTATAILQQIELGNLSYSDTLSEFVSGIKYGNEITVRDMLDMESGVYEFESNSAFQAAVVVNPGMKWEPSDTVELLPWLQHFVTVGTAHFLYGPKNPIATDPELEGAFWNFDRGLGPLLIDIFPSVTAMKPYRGREAIVSRRRGNL